MELVEPFSFKLVVGNIIVFVANTVSLARYLWYEEREQKSAEAMCYDLSKKEHGQGR